MTESDVSAATQAMLGLLTDMIAGALREDISQRGFTSVEQLAEVAVAKVKFALEAKDIEIATLRANLDGEMADLTRRLDRLDANLDEVAPLSEPKPMARRLRPVN